MVWFPLRVDDSATTWSFDIVGLLAVVGGSSITKHAQAITASPLVGIPRLLPAPETMLDTDRPATLPPVPGVTVVGVHTGKQLNELPFFADVILDTESLEEYQFQSYRITYKKTDTDAERNSIPTYIPLRKFCPLNLLTLASILMTIALFVWAGLQRDAIGLLGLGTMSISTSTACLSAMWTPGVFPAHLFKSSNIPGDVIIRTRRGALISVKCEDDVARELFEENHSCQYTFEGRFHQTLLATSTVLLMASIIFFSNCTWKIQIAVGLAYIILNLAYWAMALLTSPKDLWDIGVRYDAEVVEERTVDSLAGVLCVAIRTTGKIGWVKKASLAPSTKIWDRWLREAKKNLHNPTWAPDAAYNQLMAETLEPTESTAVSPPVARASRLYRGPRTGRARPIKAPGKWRAGTLAPRIRAGCPNRPNPRSRRADFLSRSSLARSGEHVELSARPGRW